MLLMFCVGANLVIGVDFMNFIINQTFLTTRQVHKALLFSIKIEVNLDGTDYSCLNLCLLD